MVVVGTTLMTASLDGTVRRWSLKEQDLVTPLPKDIAESLSGGSIQSNVAVASPLPPSGSQFDGTDIRAKGQEVKKESMMTEEEEQELAELMGSDDDD